MVVYDNIAIIWQIKNLKLNNKGLYKKSEVEKNLRQLSGAKRRLFGIKKPLRLKNPRRGVEMFDPTLINKIFLISVLFGQGEEVFSFIEEVKNHKIHIFDEEFTKIILKELDTITDFIEYLIKKEALISPGKSFFIIGGEKELLSSYLFNNRSFDIFNDADNVVIEEGSWDYLQDRPEYIAKKQEDKISYFWDHMVNRAHESGNKEYELVAKELARPNRVNRRFLSKVFLNAWHKANEGEDNLAYRHILISDKLTYCFLFQDDHTPTRELRKKYLETICFIARGKYIKNKKVIGIATERKIEPTCSYDFYLLYLPEWSDECQKTSEEIQNKFGIFLNPSVQYIREEEYPV